jgi:hypothetical protein
VLAVGVALGYKVKNIGKPYAGKSLVRFDEGGLGVQSPTLQKQNYSYCWNNVG